MESMLDPLVESLFGQLKAKFVDYVETSCGHEQEHQLGQKDMQINRDHETIVNAHQYLCESLANVDSIDANCQINSTNHIEPPLVLINEQIDDLANVQCEPQQNDDSINSLSSSVHQTSLFPQYSMVSASTSTDASSSEMQQQQQLTHIKHNQSDDEQECDCDECVYGGGCLFDVKEEDDEDDDDSVQLIDDDQENDELSPLVKKIRMDSTQPNDAQPVVEEIVHKRQPINQAQKSEKPNKEVDRM